MNWSVTGKVAGKKSGATPLTSGKVVSVLGICGLSTIDFEGLSLGTLEILGTAGASIPADGTDFTSVGADGEAEDTRDFSAVDASCELRTTS
jgi:hypothetical protein